MVRTVMNCEDQIFLEKLGGPIGHGPKWKVFMRRGRVLLVMPASKDGMEAGARMYSPQRLVARMARWCLLELPVLWRLLPSLRWQVCEDSPMGRIIKDSESQAGAILLGNPDHEGRRALIMTQGSQPMVIKMGVGENALRLVRGEQEFMDSESADCHEMLPLDFKGAGENWAAFGVRFLKTGTVELKDLCEILESWSEDRMVSFEELKSAPLLRSSAHPHAARVMEQCQKLKLRPTRVHGDLAPWNVRRGERGEPVMIDWEEGRRGDVPCWDLVHFVFQKTVLVDRLDPLATMAVVIESLKKSPARVLLEQTGWGKNVYLLLASYLIVVATEDFHVEGIIDNLDYRKIA